MLLTAIYSSLSKPKKSFPGFIDAQAFSNSFEEVLRVVRGSSIFVFYWIFMIFRSLLRGYMTYHPPPPLPPSPPPRPHLCKFLHALQVDNYFYSAIFIQLKIILRSKVLITGRHFDLLIKDLSITFSVENDTLLKIIVKITYGVPNRILKPFLTRPNLTSNHPSARCFIR
jgi:hypothetical protein